LALQSIELKITDVDTARTNHRMNFQMFKPAHAYELQRVRTHARVEEPGRDLSSHIPYVVRTRKA
jgi:hypothetical protein